MRSANLVRTARWEQLFRATSRWGPAFILPTTLFLNACDLPDEKASAKKFDFSSALDAPDGRRQVLDLVVGDEVLVLRSVSGEQVVPNNTWSGKGEESLTQATSVCSSGLVIVEPANNETFNFWQIVVPSAASTYGSASSDLSDREFAECVSRQSAVCFTVERHSDALRVGPLADGSRSIRPENAVASPACQSSDG